MDVFPSNRISFQGYRLDAPGERERYITETKWFKEFPASRKKWMKRSRREFRCTKSESKCGSLHELGGREKKREGKDNQIQNLNKQIIQRLRFTKKLIENRFI